MAFEAAAVAVALYLIILPLYPSFKYKLFYEKQGRLPENEARAAAEQQLRSIREAFPDTAGSLNDGTAESKETVSGDNGGVLPQNEYAVSPDRVIIPKIGVNAPIVAGTNAEYGLSQGAWLVPDTSTPDQGGNTVITGHRFKYLPTHNLTFYLFHKLAQGDLVFVAWQGQDYAYRVKETKIIEPSDLSIQAPSQEPVLTMFTCHPVYSTEKRLVVVSELIK